MISESDYLSLKVGDIVRLNERGLPTWRKLACPYATVEDTYDVGDRFQPRLSMRVFHELFPEVLITREWAYPCNIKSIVERANESESE